MNYYGYTDYGYTDYDAVAGLLGGIAIIGLIAIIIAVAVSVIQLIGMWKLFKKAGKGGWESLIPFYSNYVLIEISGLNWWWFLISLAPILLAFIPGVNLLASLASLFALFNCYYNLSKKFNKGTGFAICLTLFTPICIPILGFSKNNIYSNVYVSNNGVFGPSGNNNNNNTYNNMNNNGNYNYQNNSNNNIQPVNNDMINNSHQMQSSNEINNTDNQGIETIQPQQSSFCGNCGTKLDSNVRFCPNCGKERV